MYEVLLGGMQTRRSSLLELHNAANADWAILVRVELISLICKTAMSIEILQRFKTLLVYGVHGSPLICPSHVLMGLVAAAICGVRRIFAVNRGRRALLLHTCHAVSAESCHGQFPAR